MLRVRSSRRAVALKPDDYDHEICLVNHDPTPRALSPETTPAGALSTARLASPGGESGHAAPNDGTALVEQSTERDRPRPNAHQGQGDGRDEVEHQTDLLAPALQPAIEVEAPTPETVQQNARRSSSKRTPPKRQTAIDILYENERGGFLCGAALFSSRALGGLDPPPWTNAYHKASPTSTHTAQVPDPSWEWVWPDWRINHQEGMDEDGWEYSFAFSKRFSWHRAKWWNSFVRRRAWTRKRAKKKALDMSSDPHMLNTDYFTVRSASHTQRYSTGSLGGRAMSGSSISQLSTSEAEELPDIDNMESLLRTLRQARIDREKREAVENYVDHAIDLSELQDEMHEIMSLFVFQASRRQLLSHLMRKHDKAVHELAEKDSKDKGRLLEHRKEALDAAIAHAQEEVSRLAYWSDVKCMEGDVRDSFDSEQGLYDAKSGLDQNGPTQASKGKSRVVRER